MLKVKNLTEEQMFTAALAYEAGGCDIPMEEFLQKVLSKYEEINALRKKAPIPPARTGSKSKAGL